MSVATSDTEIDVCVGVVRSHNCFASFSVSATLPGAMRRTTRNWTILVVSCKDQTRSMKESNASNGLVKSRSKILGDEGPMD